MRPLRIIARQLADGLEAPGWAERKLAAVQVLRHSAQASAHPLGPRRKSGRTAATAPARRRGTRRPPRACRVVRGGGPAPCALGPLGPVLGAHAVQEASVTPCGAGTDPWKPPHR
ncbi:hypothetical protein OQI_23835 [Streptomyces pharetrae CZA14]|uniref:Uncharacterized protein n=1 Tax=Streptomyces pharetrae CZA14 TaxID=1144883 RepID=A0ABX3YF12_9ACTN|nr:hypothetical protein OQI_23835 [Streptomyces pharetrae CZA14]